MIAARETVTCRCGAAERSVLLWSLGAIRTPGVRSVLLPVLLSALSACGDNGTDPGASMVGAQGGIASLAGGAVTLSVPSGALTGPVEFTANPISSVPDTARFVPGSAYEIGPPGTDFAGLATLTISYDPRGLPEGVRQSELRLQRGSGDSWTASVGSTVDTLKHVVSGKIESVGRFGAVALPVTSVSLYPDGHTLGPGGTVQLYTTVRGAEGQGLPDRKVTWTSSDEAVATVDDSGLVTGVGAGSALVTAIVEEQHDAMVVTVFDCSTQTSISAKECLALIAIYDRYTNSQWRSTTSYVRGTDPCGWWGVTCAGGSVSGLTLDNGQYKGSISQHVGDLSGLMRLEVKGVNVSGSIPPSLGSLTKLETLSLTYTSLTGPIPRELGQLSNLKELYLYLDSLSGPIPPELGDLSQLTELSLGWNRLTGPIPQELGNLSSLVELQLMANHLTGSIPRQLGGLTTLQTLGLASNELTGGIPQELGNLANLVGLNLANNQLSGAIPGGIGNLSNLESVTLFGNKLSGPIPLGVAQLGGRIQAARTSQDCIFAPPGNTGLTLADAQDFRSADLDADGKICGVAIGQQ